MFAPDDPVFAWAVVRALLIVIAAVGILIYAAWAVTWQRHGAPHVGTLKNGALKYKSSVKRAKSRSLPAELTEEAEAARHILASSSADDIRVHESGQPAVAA